MNVGPSGEGSKGSPSNSPPPSIAAAPGAELAKYESETVGERGAKDSREVPPKTTTTQKDTLSEPTKQSAPKAKKKRTWKKPEGMPKRPLSAYNMYFREQRQELLGEEVSSAFPVTDQTKRKHRRSHGKVGFQEMASIIGKKWKALTAEERKTYEEMAAIEKAKYKKKVERWRSGQDDAGTAEGDGDAGNEVSKRSEDGNVSAATHALHSGPMDPSMGYVSRMSGPSSVTGQPVAVQHSGGVGQTSFDQRSTPQFLPRLQHQTSNINARMMPRAGGFSDSGRMMPTAGRLPDSGRMMPSMPGLSDSGRMMSGAGGLSDSMMMIPGSAALSGDSEGGRLDHLQRMYELRVREAALLREEMERSLAQSQRPVGTALPVQNLQSAMGEPTGYFGGPGNFLGVGQGNQQSRGSQSNMMGGDSRRMSLGSSIRSLPQQQQQQQQQQYPNDAFSPGGQQQLRQAEEAWQHQLALGNPGGLSQQFPQQQHQMGSSDHVTALREQRNRLLQQALESERVYRAEEELQRYLRRQSGPGGGM